MTASATPHTHRVEPASIGHDADALLRLVAAGGSAAARRRLLDSHGTPSDALRAGASAWRAAGLDARQVSALQTRDDAERSAAHRHALAWLDAPGHHLVGWHDADYPALLRRIGSPPLALFVAGDPARLWHPCVAVVGSRSASAGGRDNAAAFSRALVDAGFGVVSGLAAGIDTVAHDATLRAGGITVAVLGTGADVPYPRANAGLHARIAADGAVVSEHLPGTPARKEHFPSRNRIIAGLALGTLVVEAAERSGALITARLATEAGREAFAVPGSIHNPMARGCHRLIRDGAALVERADEVIDALAPLAAELGNALRARLDAPSSAVATEMPAAAEPLTPDSADYNRLWAALGHDPTGMDRLAARTGLTAATLSSMLLIMELEGRVYVERGRYSRKS